MRQARLRTWRCPKQLRSRNSGGLDKFDGPRKEVRMAVLVVAS